MIDGTSGMEQLFTDNLVTPASSWTKADDGYQTDKGDRLYLNMDLCVGRTYTFSATITATLGSGEITLSDSLEITVGDGYEKIDLSATEHTAFNGNILK